MKILISFIIAVFILSGCGSNKRVVIEKKELPTWYLSPAKTTQNTLYSVGEGKDKDEAITNALNAMVSTLNVSISSDFNTKTVVKDGVQKSYQSTTTNDISSEVKRINISNYEILNYKEFGFENHLVAIKSDKVKLFLSLQKELEQKFLVIKNKNLEAKKYNAVKELSIYKENLKATYDVKNIVAVMGSLKSSFDGSLYINKAQDTKNRYEKFLSKISFSVNCNRDSIRLKPVIIDGLNSSGYSVKDSGGKNHFKIHIESETIESYTYGFDIVRSAIFISVKDNEGVIVGSNKLNITGQSTQGYEYAKESVAMKLNSMLQRDGISTILGLGR